MNRRKCDMYYYNYIPQRAMDAIIYPCCNFYRMLVKETPTDHLNQLRDRNTSNTGLIYDEIYHNAYSTNSLLEINAICFVKSGY